MSGDDCTANDVTKTMNWVGGDRLLLSDPVNSSFQSAYSLIHVSGVTEPRTTDEKKTRVSRAVSSRMHNEYFESVLRTKWDRTPDTAFSKKRWREWILLEAMQRKEDINFSNAEVLDGFVNAILSFVTSDTSTKNIYFEKLCKVSGEENREQLSKRRQEYDDKETRKLMREVNGDRESLSSDEDTLDEETDWLKTSRLKETNHYSRSSAEKECLNASHIEDFENNPAVGLFQTSSSHKGMPESNIGNTRKRINRTGEGNRLSRKKFKPSLRENYQRLNITCNGRAVDGTTGKPLGVLNARTTSPITRRDYEDLSTGNIENWEHTSSEPRSSFGADVVIENPTPPCSPAFTKIQESSHQDTHDTDNNETLNSQKCTAQKLLQKKENNFTRKTAHSVNISSQSQFEGIAKRRNSASSERGTGPIRATARQSFSEMVMHVMSNYEASKAGDADSQDDEELELPDIPNGNDHEETDKENNPVTLQEIISKYPKPPSAPSLSLEMFEQIRIALEKPAKEKIVSGFSFNILQEDLAIFNDNKEWLIDLNMDFYLELIKERSKEGSYPSVYVFHSFFYTLFTQEEGYDAVQEATGEDDIFKFDLVFFPVNLNQHWRLVVVQFGEKTLKCYDSLVHDNSQILKNIAKYLRCEYRRKHRNIEASGIKVSEDLNTSETARSRSFFCSDIWTVENVNSEEIPQQKNAIDCGIFCLQFAEYISRQKDFDFDQNHIPYFRKRMMFETLTKRLLTS